MKKHKESHEGKHATSPDNDEVKKKQLVQGRIGDWEGGSKDSMESPLTGLLTGFSSIQ